MSGLFSRGLVLDQNKEPALSRDLREFAPGGGAPLEIPAAEDPSALSGDEILRYARLADIVDERDGAMLDEKLLEGRRAGAVLLVADAMDDEPYVSSQLNPLFKLSQQAVQGLWLAAKAAGTRETQIAVYKNISEVRLKIPGTLYGVKIKRITGKYPVEARTRFSGKGKEVLLVGVGALIHLYRAVYRGVRQSTAFVTVAGDCVANPQNLEVPLGATAGQVLERCGLIEEPGRVVLGGPMTGQSVTQPDSAEIDVTTRAVLAFRSDARNRHFQCIGCGKCVRVCPRRLSPVYLYKAARTRQVRLLRQFDVTMCIGCGTCSYICPAKLDLSVEIRAAGDRVRQLDLRAGKEKEGETAHVTSV